MAKKKPNKKKPAAKKPARRKPVSRKPPKKSGPTGTFLADNEAGGEGGGTEPPDENLA